MTMTTKAYRIEHSNNDIYCEEAYGIKHHPVFTDRSDAATFMENCEEAWPVDAQARDMYFIRTFASVEDALADEHGQLMN